MKETMTIFLIAVLMAIGYLCLLLAYRDSCRERRFSWSGVGVSLLFFGAAFMMIWWID